MIRICSKCGSLLKEDTRGCPFCEVSVEDSDLLQPVAAGEAASEEAAEPEWRREVGRRLELYRARRRGAKADETQPDLPFREPARRAQTVEIPERPRTLARIAPKPRQAERMEICIQPELDFAPAPGDRARPQTALVPVAALGKRREAGVFDALFIVLTCAAFAGLFHSLGGHIALDRIDALVCGAVLYLFYALYFLVFTVLGGATPGMQIAGLSVVRLDGSLADTGQLQWRGFGYLLSGAALMLGFLWALWDEDAFTWQDRISQTYLTSASPLAGGDVIELGSSRRLAAHK